MEDYIIALDEFFAAQYSDYVKLSALKGYEMPEVVYVGKDGNIERRDSSVMRLSHQKNKEALLKTLKEGLADTSFTFNFCFRSASDRSKDVRRKYTFAKILPDALRRCGETIESAGEKLALVPDIWKRIAKGTVYPEKNTVIALALVTGMKRQDVTNLFNVCGFTFDNTVVRDVVAEYLLENGIFNREMQFRCLKEYKITSLPIKEN